MPKFGAQIDTLNIPVKGLTPEGGTAFPSSPTEGLFFHRTDTKTFHIYLNGAWQQCDNQGVAASVHTHAIAQVTGLQAALDAKAPTANPTFTGTVTGVTKAHVGLGNVDNTSDLNKPISTATQTALNGKANTTHTHTKSQITDLGAASETVAGLVELATTAEASTGTDTARAVTPAGVKAALDALVGAAPSLLNTLDEIAAALGDDPNFATTMTTALAGKASTTHGHALTDASITGTLPVNKGGTGVTSYQSLRGALEANRYEIINVPALSAGVEVELSLPNTAYGAAVTIREAATGNEVFLDVRLDVASVWVKSDVNWLSNQLKAFVLWAD